MSLLWFALSRSVSAPRTVTPVGLVAGIITKNEQTILLYILQGRAMKKGPVCDDRCALAHFLNNKINIIFGTCDLLSQHTTDPQVVDRLLAIRVAAKAMIDEINKPPSRSQNA
jgi:hypothetical protein